MVEGNVWYLLNALPVIGITAIFFTILGWKMCSRKSQRRSFEEAGLKVRLTELEKRLAAAKDRESTLEAEAETLRASLNEVPAAPPPVDDTEVLRTALRDAQAEVRVLQSRNARLDDSLTLALEQARDGGKSAQLKRFELESQLSKAREELARMRQESSSDDPTLTDLQAEVAQLRRSLAAATSAFGQAQRERDAARAALNAQKSKAAEPQLSLDTEIVPAGPEAGPEPDVKATTANQPSPDAARQQAKKYAAAAAERRAKRNSGKLQAINDKEGAAAIGTEH